MAITAANGRSIQLSDREGQVLRLAAEGMTDRQIAGSLGISQDTVGTYWRRILLRFGASRRTEVVARAAEIEARSRIEQVEAQTESLTREIAERTQAQARELAYRNLLEAIAEASMRYIAGSQEVEQIFDRLLSSVLHLTVSEFGFIAEVVRDGLGTPTLKSRAIATVARRNKTSDGSAPVGTCELDKVLEIVDDSGKPYLCNSPKPGLRIGLFPHAHPPLKSFLAMPVFDGPDMVGLVGIANRPSGYEELLAEYLQPLLTTCANIIVASRIEEKRSELDRKLMDTAARLRALMDALSSAVLFEDDQRRLLFVNDGFCRYFGIPAPPKALVGMDCAAAAVQSSTLFRSPEQFLERIEAIFAAGEPVLGDRVELIDGRVFSRDFLPVTVEGERRGYLWHYRDVTPESRQSDILYAVLDASDEAVVAFEPTGTVVLWNRRAAEMLGYAAHESLGRSIDELFGFSDVRSDRTVELRHRDGYPVSVRIRLVDVGQPDRPVQAAFLKMST